jgi:hypothetical protein
MKSTSASYPYISGIAAEPCFVFIGNEFAEVAVKIRKLVDQTHYTGHIDKAAAVPLAL